MRACCAGSLVPLGGRAFARIHVVLIVCHTVLSDLVHVIHCPFRLSNRVLEEASETVSLHA